MIHLFGGRTEVKLNSRRIRPGLSGATCGNGLASAPPLLPSVDRSLAARPCGPLRRRGKGKRSAASKIFFARCLGSAKKNLLANPCRKPAGRIVPQKAAERREQGGSRAFCPPLLSEGERERSRASLRPSGALGLGWFLIRQTGERKAPGCSAISPGAGGSLPCLDT